VSLPALSVRLVALLPLVFLLGNCGGKCKGASACPTGGTARIALPTDLPAPVTSFATDAPCAVSGDPSDDGRLVDFLVSSPAVAYDLTCPLRIKLANGMELVGAATFRPIDSCCPTNTLVAGPDFKLVDTGPDVAIDAGAIDIDCGAIDTPNGG
jgi:hypothetical protein